MSSPNKITFGNNAATSYSLKYKFSQPSANPNFAYQSGDQITNFYSPYNLASTGQNVAATTSYSTYEVAREGTNANYKTQPYSTSFSSGQVTTPVVASYESGRNVTYASPAAKVTFGGKSYTPTYAPTTSTYQATYQHSAPAPIQYQTYQTYQQPVEITTQPIRNEVREEVVVEQPKVETVPEVRKSNVGATVVEPVKETKTKTKKGGCPSWLWPLLGILALLALILGLLFGLGVFGRIGGASTPTISGTTGTTTAATTGTTETTATTTGITTAGGQAGAAATTGTTTTGVTSPTGYTIIQETVVLSKDKVTTTGVTTPTVTTITTPNVTTPTVTTPTVNVTNPIIPETLNEDEDYSIDPTVVTSIPVTTTSYAATSTPTTTTSLSSSTATNGTSSNFSIESSKVSGTTYPTGATPSSTGTTYPTGITYSGYGSNPALGTTGVQISTTTSSTTPYVDYVVPTSAY